MTDNVPGTPHDITLGEVYRLLVSMDRKIEETNRNVVGRAEYESDQEGNAARHKANEDALREWKQTSTEAHIELGVRITAVAQRVETGEKAQKENRSKWILAIVMAVASPIAAILVSLIFRGVI